MTKPQPIPYGHSSYIDHLPMTLTTFIYLQIQRILGRVQVHAPGPRKPTLGQQEGTRPRG